MVIFFYKFRKLFFFSKKIMRCSKKYINFFFQSKWTKSQMYTLRRAKSNATIHFVLSLKLAAPKNFPWTPQKPYIFYATRFLYGLEKNRHKQKRFIEWFSSCLEHFSLNCIIKMLNLKVNNPLKYMQILTWNYYNYSSKLNLSGIL